jgi:hypothetical protein
LAATTAPEEIKLLNSEAIRLKQKLEKLQTAGLTGVEAAMTLQRNGNSSLDRAHSETPDLY